MENHKINTEITSEDIDKLLEDQIARRIIVRESHYIFFHLYFSGYTKNKTAPFQREMFDITEDTNMKMAVIVAFRGSGKSTIMTMSYPIWAVLGKQQKKCVVILSQTQQQVKIHMGNIKRELEANELLRSDLGPFEESSDEWGSTSLYIPKFNAKIVGASSEQSIRGIRHGAHRPDLIICDDVEDLPSTKTKEGRDRAYNWFTGEIVPLGEEETKIIMVGNLLHEDSLLMRLRKNIEEVGTNVLYREYPIINEKEEILWKGRYPTMEALEIERKVLGDDKAWQREYMLKIIADEDQIVRKEWIQYYDELPIDRNKYRHTLIGVDLAISSSSHADYTAIVVGHVFGYEETMQVYIEKYPVNKRMDFPTSIEKIKEVAKVSEKFGRRCKLYIEDVGYQKAVVQQLNRLNVSAEGFPVNGQDKRARLDSVTYMIRSGKVLFPKKGTEDLIQQLVYFGVEKHDDLVDAFTMVLHMAIKKDRGRVRVLTREEADLIRWGSSSYRGGYWSGGNRVF
jgi:predicted phage terminase large subunit-like protein